HLQQCFDRQLRRRWSCLAWWRDDAGRLQQCRGGRWRWLGDRWFRLGRSLRLRIALSRDRQPLAKIVGVEPFLLAHGFEQAIIPQTPDVDVELPTVSLIDGLHTISGDRPLPADPVDVAMQRHLRTLVVGLTRSP